MGSKRIPAEIRQEALAKVREGKSVKSVAEEYGFSTKNIYNWLERSTEGKDNQILEISRLKRENQTLLTLVGKITYQQELAKKNWSNK